MTCCHCPPRWFSVATLAVIMILYWVAAVITTQLLVRNAYPPLPDNDDDNHWVMMGGLTANQVEFRIRNKIQNDSNIRLIVGLDENYNDVVFEKDLPTTDNNNNSTTILVHSVTATGLQATTKYYYATFLATTTSTDTQDYDGVRGPLLASGQFQTAPVQGTRQSFTFVASACAQSGSTHGIFEHIQNVEQDALFVLHLGDFHYEDLNTEELSRRLQAIDRVLSSPSQNILYQNKPLVYMWDDHDWLGNDSDQLGPEDDRTDNEVSRQVALQSYRVAMPYYSPLPTSTPAPNASLSDRGMYHAFTIGAVRFIVSDLRSEALPGVAIYSDEQRQWLLNEFANATNYDFVIWMTSKPWINEDSDDDWSAFEEDRRELSNFISSDQVSNNVLAISADAHMVALDDGSNTYYGNDIDDTTTKKSFPILQTGPFDRTGSTKGGPFSEGCTAFELERNHQYSVIEYSFDNDQACLKIQSYRMRNPTTRTLILEKKFCGKDIFAESNPGTGSCQGKNWSPINQGLVIASASLLVIAMMLPCFYVNVAEDKQQRRCSLQSVGVSIMIFLLFAVTYATGILVPLLQGFEQYNAFETTLIGLLQIGTVVVYLLLWQRHNNNVNKRSSNEREDHENNDEPLQQQEADDKEDIANEDAKEMEDAEI